MDNIRPDHYKNGIECIDLIKDTPFYEGFLIGNIIKYVYRFKDKGGYEDLKKAETYTKWLLKKNHKEYKPDLEDNKFNTLMISLYKTEEELRNFLQGLIINTLSFSYPNYECLRRAMLLLIDTQYLIDQDTKGDHVGTIKHNRDDYDYCYFDVKDKQYDEEYHKKWSD